MTPLRRRGPRGAALVETCLVLIPMLTILVGTLQLGIIGYFQLVSNGASYLGGRQEALRAAASSSALNLALSSTYTSQTPGRFAVNGASPGQGINFGGGNGNYYNQNGGGAPSGTAGGRSGGASFIRLGQLSTSTGFPNLAGFNFFNGIHSAAPTVSAINLEGQAFVTGTDFNPNNIDYNDPTYFASTATAWQNQRNVNLPPFFATVVYDYECADEYEFPNGPDCISGHGRVQARGLAEYLDDRNLGKKPGLGMNQAFHDMVCHQQYFANLLRQTFTPGSFPAFSAVNAPPLYTPATQAENFEANSGNIDSRFLATGPTANPLLVTVYSWDVPQPVNAGNPEVPGNAQNALHPSNGC